jgi:hypothetical protein
MRCLRSPNPEIEDVNTLVAATIEVAAFAISAGHHIVMTNPGQAPQDSW